MAINPAEVLARLAAIPEQIARTTEGWEAAELAVPLEDGWSVREVVAHMRASCDILAHRLYVILVCEEPLLHAYNERRWAKVARYAQADFQSALTEYKLRRAGLVDMLSHIAPDDWKLIGIHEVHGPCSLLELALSLVEHEEEHCAQLETICRK